MSLINGAVKLIDVPNDFCLTTAIDLLKFLEKHLALEFDSAQITNVYVSVTEPDTTDRDVIWYKINNSGSFVGIFVFIQDAWVQLFPVPQQVSKVYGDSRDIPIGYELISSSTPGFTSAMSAKLQLDWLRDPTDTYWVIFDVVYIGV